jgi:L-cysteine desulfidase
MTDAALLAELIAERAQVATVCTEPAMIAFAGASAAKLLGRLPDEMSVVTCSGVFKNALGGGLPGTERRGPAMAAALGAVINRPEAKLAILQAITPEQLAAADAMIDAGKVRAEADPTRDGVYVGITVRGGGHVATVTVAGGHSRVAEASRDGMPVTLDNEPADRGSSLAPAAPALPATADLTGLRGWSFERLVTAALSLAYQDIAYLRDGAASNRALGDAVLDQRCTVPASLGVPPLGLDLLSLVPSANANAIDRRIRSLVSAAVAARMTGQEWPVLTSAGSGNQGITVGIPVSVVAEALGASPDRQARALGLAHAINLYVHAFIGEVSPACGAVSAASGVAVAVCWLLDGDMSQMESAAQLTLAGLLGMICDGAKDSCALKCGTGAVEGLMCGQWARSGVKLRAETGIIGNSLSETLALAQSIVEDGLRQADGLIIAARNPS